MRLRSLRFLCVVLLTLPGSLLFAQSPVGEITSAVGFVEIDAFGVGVYVDVRIPEPLYEESVIRTDYESWAYLTISENEHVIAPNSTSPVSSFLSERRRDKGQGFFSRILREITRSLSPPEEEEIVAGGRARSVEESGTSWVFDIDPDDLFAEALVALDEGDFEYAVESLRLIEYPSDGAFEIEEYYVKLSYGLMGLGDFHAAMNAAFEYLLVDPRPELAADLPARLQLLGGVAAFYSGEDAVSDAALTAYFESVSLDEVAAEAVAIRYGRLVEDGTPEDAARLLDRVRRAQPEVDWDALVRR